MPPPKPKLRPPPSVVGPLRRPRAFPRAPPENDDDDDDDGDDDDGDDDDDDSDDGDDDGGVLRMQRHVESESSKTNG